MINPKTTLPITDIVLDEAIYPRARIDQKRVEKHNWPEPLVWSLALEGKDDHEQFKQLNRAFGPNICGDGLIMISALAMIGLAAYPPN